MAFQFNNSLLLFLSCSVKEILSSYNPLHVLNSVTRWIVVVIILYLVVVVVVVVVNYLTHSDLRFTDDRAVLYLKSNSRFS